MNFRLLVLVLVALALCPVTPPLYAQPVPTEAFPFKMTVEEYINQYAPVAVEEMHRNRIPASITLAQGLIESGNGNSRLAKMGNNHFGIKCKKEWTGDTLHEDDDAPEECFRKYPSAVDSYRDHSLFLKQGQRYAFLFDLELTDYSSWAHGLKKAGYATNPRYAEILIGIIEKNGLHRFDTVKAGVQETIQIAESKKEEQVLEQGLVINGVPAIRVPEGGSFVSIALANDMRVWQLYKYNDLGKDALLKTGDTLYLKPKNYKGETDFHTVERYESMHWISQRYAIKLSRLLTLNRMKEGQEPENGEQLNLRKKRGDTPKLKSVSITQPQPDSLADYTVYADPKKNVETAYRQLPHDPYDLQAHGVKEPMAFIHTVQAGETLFAISKRYNIQVAAIQQLNRLSSETIKPGDMLIINPNQPPVDKGEESVVPGYHTVLQGETLYGIARLYGTTVTLLKTLNELEHDTIRAGDELIILPRFGETPGEQVVSDDAEGPVYYIVREGETVFSICRKFNIQQEQLRNMNQLLDNTIQVGQKLRVR